MSHHFDTKLAKEDPNLNVCDLYLFAGAPNTTVMAMTVNPDVGLSTPDVLHHEGLYALRFDLNGDAREDVVFKFRFGEPRHANKDEQIHVQSFQVRRAVGEAMRGDAGEILIEGETGRVHGKSGVRVYVGTTPELFAGDAFALHAFLNAFYKDHRYDGDAFLHRQDFFAKRNITALVLEVPNHLIGEGRVHAWATTSLHGHAPEMQVQRWGLPLITHLFLTASNDLKDKFNASVPADDIAFFSKPIAEFAERMSTYAGSVVNPAEYGKQIVARLCPAMLPYVLGTQAAFDQAGFNGRPLGEDVMDVMLTLASNKPLADGAAPDRSRIRSDFPYFGEPYSKAEQAGVTPVPRPAQK
jgi:hypothetical protein